MKIHKHPKFNICTCATCGTVFQPEAGDRFEYRILPTGETYKIYAYCPMCGHYCETTETKETTENACDPAELAHEIFTALEHANVVRLTGDYWRIKLKYKEGKVKNEVR